MVFEANWEEDELLLLDPLLLPPVLPVLPLPLPLLIKNGINAKEGIKQTNLSQYLPLETEPPFAAVTTGGWPTQVVFALLNGNIHDDSRYIEEESKTHSQIEW